jgi:hypothetical protein
MISFITRLFNPLVSPLVAFTILIAWMPVSLQETTALKMLHWIIASTFSGGLIFLYISYLKYKQVINTTELVEREHRINPLTFAIISYAVGYVLLTASNAPAIVRALMLCYVTNSIVVLIITRRWKISLHTTALGNAVMALVYYGGWMLIPVFGLIPIVAAGRVQSKKHDLLQVSVGGLLGTVMTGLQFYFLGIVGQ